MKKSVIFLLAGGVLGSGVTAQFGEVNTVQAVSHQVPAKATVEDVPQPQRGQIETFLNNNMCPQLDSKWGLAGDNACSIPDLFVDNGNITIYWRTEDEVIKLKMKASADIDGYWTPGNPQ